MFEQAHLIAATQARRARERVELLGHVPLCRIDVCRVITHVAF